MTNTLSMFQLRSVDLLPLTLRTIPEAIGKKIAIARARTRSRIMAVVKADGYGHGLRRGLCTDRGSLHCSIRPSVPLVTALRRRREHCKNPNAAGQVVWVEARQWGRVA